jgi:hypothetical protein
MSVKGRIELAPPFSHLWNKEFASSDVRATFIYRPIIFKEIKVADHK